MMKKIIKQISLAMLFIFFAGYGVAQSNWSINSSSYNLDYTIIAEIQINQNYSINPQDQVAAFDNNGVIRGYANLVFDNTLNKYMVNLTVLSNTVNDSISFKIYDAANNSIYNSMNAPMLFTPNLVVGTPVSPYVISNTNDLNGIDLSNTEILDQQAINSFIGELTTSQPNPTGQVYSYSFIAGAGDVDNSSFTIQSDSLLVNTSIDFNTDSTFSIRVKSISNLGVTIEEEIALTVKKNPVGINEFDLVKTIIYPNPFNNMLSVAFSKSEHATIKLFDVTGKLIIEVKTKTLKVHQLSVESLLKGVYFLQIETKENIEIKRIIKK